MARVKVPGLRRLMGRTLAVVTGSVSGRRYTTARPHVSELPSPAGSSEDTGSKSLTFGDERNPPSQVTVAAQVLLATSGLS